MKTRTYRFAMLWSEEEISRIDDWRRNQPDIPSRAEAVRRLVAEALQEAPPKPPMRKP